MNSNCSAGVFSVMRYRASWNMTSEQLLFITQCLLNNVVYVLNGMKNRNKGLMIYHAILLNMIWYALRFEQKRLSIQKNGVK